MFTVNMPRGCGKRRLGTRASSVMKPQAARQTVAAAENAPDAGALGRTRTGECHDRA